MITAMAVTTATLEMSFITLGMMMPTRKLTPLDGVGVKVALVFGTTTMRLGALVVDDGAGAKEEGKEAGAAVGMVVMAVAMSEDGDIILTTVELIISTRKLSLADGVVLEVMMPLREIGVMVMPVILVAGLTAMRIVVLSVIIGVEMRALGKVGAGITIGAAMGKVMAAMGVGTGAGVGLVLVMEGVITSPTEVFGYSTSSWGTNAKDTGKDGDGMSTFSGGGNWGARSGDSWGGNSAGGTAWGGTGRAGNAGGGNWGGFGNDSQGILGSGPASVNDWLAESTNSGRNGDWGREDRTGGSRGGFNNDSETQTTGWGA